MKFLLHTCLFFYILQLHCSEIIYKEFDNEIELSTKYFPKKPAYLGQKENAHSLSLLSELYIEWDNNLSGTFSPYIIYDKYDSSRTSFDFKELFFLYYSGDWEYNIGLKQIFWGITESNNIVDIINQTDIAADLRGNSKLGQPLISISKISDMGIFEVYYLPVFRERTAVGESGRLRLSSAIDKGNPLYLGSAGKNKPDWAIRWSNNYNEWDVSTHYFRGTMRDPTIIPLLRNGELKYITGYQRVSQSGGTAQKILGPLLFKLESIFRKGQNNTENNRNSFFSWIAGAEWKITRFYEKPWDLTFYMEYNKDSRGNKSTVSLENDLFFGSLLNLNDINGSELFISTTIDSDGAGNTFFTEYSRRMGESWRVTSAINIYWNSSVNDNLYSLRRDDNIQFTFKKYF